MKNLYIIKIGGSVITKKKENHSEAKKEVIARVAREIARAHRECSFSLIVVHGVGPFGHTTVREYNISNGVFSEKQKEGYLRTVKGCNYLGAVVVEELQNVGIDAVLFNPASIIMQENKKVVKFETTGIMGSINAGRIPVLFGQMVPDTALNASVISGDRIIAFLAIKFSPKKVLIGTDVSGIFTADPKRDKNAKRIKTITQENFAEIIKSVSGSQAVDVTGGMKGKLEELKKMLGSTPAFIFDANEKDSVYRVLTEKEVTGTKIQF